MAQEALYTVLQVAVSPVIVLSAVGLLLLMLNNRLSTSITRARLLAEAYTREQEQARRAVLAREIDIVRRRARMLRASVGWHVASGVCTSALVIVLFLDAASMLELSFLVPILFIASLLCIIVGLIQFLIETRLVLEALTIELDAVQGQPRGGSR